MVKGHPTGSDPHGYSLVSFITKYIYMHVVVQQGIIPVLYILYIYIYIYIHIYACSSSVWDHPSSVCIIYIYIYMHVVVQQGVIPVLYVLYTYIYICM